MKVRHVFTESLLQGMSGHTEGTEEKEGEHVNDHGNSGDANNPEGPNATAKPFDGWTDAEEW